MHSDLKLMNTQSEVLYLHNGDGHMTAVNEPGNQPAPRLFWGQTAAGSIVKFRSDMQDALVQEVTQLINKTRTTERLALVIRALEKDHDIQSLWMGPAYAFQEIRTEYTDATLVTEDNVSCLEPGFSALVSELKFRSPCYMVTEGDRAVSVCFSARSSSEAAEAGVETLEEYRGRGYAIRVVSSWAQAIRQSRRVPLYSTSWDHYSSQSIARRLGLQLYGTDVSIY